MQRKHLVSTLLLLAAFAATPAFATTFTYTAILKGSSEVPANASPATGFETFSLTGDMLTVNVTFANLTAPAAAAHIHCCSGTAATAPVVVPYLGFPNANSGTYSNVFDLSTFIFSGGGSEAALIAGFNSGQAYANIHDANFGAGEIRGQIMPSAVPEPSSLALAATGLVGMLGMARRRLRS